MSATKLASLRAFVRRAGRRCKSGIYDEARQIGIIHTGRRFSDLKYRSNADVAQKLYKWYKEQPPCVQKSRRAMYKEAKLLYEVHAQECKDKGLKIVRCGCVGQHKRRWLDSWCARFHVSFRKQNKQYKLSAPERARRLGMAFRDKIRIMHHMGEDVPKKNWDELAYFEDSLADEETLVEKGQEFVAIKRQIGGDHKKHTVIYDIGDREDIWPPTGPMVNFKGVGTRIDPKLQKHGMPVYWSDKGNTTMEMMDAICKAHEHTIPPVKKWGVCSKWGGWRVLSYDAARAHNGFEDDLLARKIMPYRVPGGLTGDIQESDVGMNQEHQEIKKDLQEDWERSELVHDPSTVPKVTRQVILDRIHKGWQVYCNPPPVLAKNIKRSLVKNTEDPDALVEISRSDMHKLVFKNTGWVKLNGKEDDFMMRSLDAVFESEGIAEFRADYIKTPRLPFTRWKTDLYPQLETGVLYEEPTEGETSEEDEEEEDGVVVVEETEAPLRGAAKRKADIAELLAGHISDEPDSPRLLAVLKRYKRIKAGEESTQEASQE